MPILTVLLSTPPNAITSAKVAQSLSQLTADILHKKPELTSIAISHVDPAHWFVGGESLHAQHKTSFFLAIRITDETNTADEKAAYIAAVFNAMADLLGDLHHESYVHVHDARAAAYGYGGLTQQQRAVVAKL
ncbi:4-oxalocrotonate tautomerase family protein [Glaciimonas sp. Gout2]|uniref:tautomerase family protein n=1 Tax=unclassified Glaciimonas TaxID=2644401 RepID=UPI002B235F69|nr:MULTISPECIES: 4-oxalocrotonate tautomerase family protein [unclassified Glaciimonas]MEB0010799.1 4-oxalocrotonate tautomerase family protein [Glaciimonas sp. Cout2]MEB0082065.1 4-oxalocrotonate tautomerase family protein [Glaciimonas sp. Gout2]